MPNHSCRDRLEQALIRIADPTGEGRRTCLTVYADQARAAADAADARAARGTPLGPLDGVIVTIKDLFDVAGEVTRAGSKILAEEAVPAWILDDLERLVPDLPDELRRLLTETEQAALVDRVERIIESGVFPEPLGDRPPYPWPLV